MQYLDQRSQVYPQQAIPADWAHLIIKLRWIGLDEEAERLEFAVGILQPEKCGTVSYGPFNTD